MAIRPVHPPQDRVYRRNLFPFLPSFLLTALSFPMHHNDTQALGDLQTMLTPDSEPVRDILPADDYERRLELAKRFERLQSELPRPLQCSMNASTFVAFLLLPMKTLEEAAVDEISAGSFAAKVEPLSSITHYCQFCTFSSSRCLSFLSALNSHPVGQRFSSCICSNPDDVRRPRK